MRPALAPRTRWLLPLPLLLPLLLPLALAPTGRLACPSEPCALRLSIVARPDAEGRSAVQANLEQAADRDDWELHTDLRKVVGEGNLPDTDVMTFTLTAKEAGDASGGWVAVGGLGRYRAHAEAKRWLDAALTCAAEGGGAHLAVPDSAAEARAIAALLRSQPSPSPSPPGPAPSDTRYFHVGVSDLAQEDSFATVTGKTWTRDEVDIWGTVQPNGGRWQNCMSINGQGKLFDDYCHYRYVFACERPL